MSVSEQLTTKILRNLYELLAMQNGQELESFTVKSKSTGEVIYQETKSEKMAN